VPFRLEFKAKPGQKVDFRLRHEIYEMLWLRYIALVIYNLVVTMDEWECMRKCLVKLIRVFGYKPNEDIVI
jgi:hypothetical protein